MSKTPRRLALAATLATASLAHAASLTTFGTGSVAFDVTADGRTVAGTLGGANFTWSAGSGFNTSIGGTAPGSSGTAGWVQISGDGSRLLANGFNSATGKYEPAVHATATGTWTLLGSLGGGSGTNSGSAYDMTADGRYVGGASYTGAAASTFHATVWDTVAGTRLDVSGGTQSRINALSDDGSVAVGYNGSSQTSAVWRRQADGSYLKSAIIRPDGSTALSATMAVSGNGLWATGASFNSALPYLYNVSTGVASYFPKLPFVSGNQLSVASPSAISNDGQTVIGTHSILGTLDTNHGFIWNAGFGVMELDAYFAGFGVDSANAYDFLSPISMRYLADGTMSVAGIARDNLTNAQVGFLVNVPAPVPEPATYALLLLGVGGIAAAVRRRRVD